TLTEGRPKLVSVEVSPGQDEAELLRLASGLERASEHPLADAVVKGAEARGLVPAGVSDFESRTGRGVTGTVEGRNVVVGSRTLLEELGVELGPLSGLADTLRAAGQTVVFVAVDGRAAGLLGIADPVKATTPEAVSLLHKEGLRVVMLTGDDRT